MGELSFETATEEQILEETKRAALEARLIEADRIMDMGLRSMGL